MSTAEEKAVLNANFYTHTQLRDKYKNIIHGKISTVTVTTEEGTSATVSIPHNVVKVWAKKEYHSTMKKLRDIQKQIQDAEQS